MSYCDLCYATNTETEHHPENAEARTPAFNMCTGADLDACNKRIADSYEATL